VAFIFKFYDQIFVCLSRHVHRISPSFLISIDLIIKVTCMKNAFKQNFFLSTLPLSSSIMIAQSYSSAKQQRRTVLCILVYHKHPHESSAECLAVLKITNMAEVRNSVIRYNCQVACICTVCSYN
jgi:hypothetical protein